MASPIPDISTEGFAELDKQLLALTDKTRGTILRAAVRKAIRPAHDRAKATIPSGTVMHKTYKGRLVAPGFSQRSIRIVVKLAKNKMSATAILGVRREAYYALNFVEFGVLSRGIPARGWLVPAMRSTRGEQVRILGEELKKGILKAARLGKR